MMNKRRTKEIGRTKYLMFLPLAAILMIVSNIEMVARTTEKFAKEMMGQATEEVAMQAETTDFRNFLQKIFKELHFHGISKKRKWRKLKSKVYQIPLSSRL
mgnify:CR=1 FL=1